MASNTTQAALHLPPVDRLANHARARALAERFGRIAVIDAIRAELAACRAALRTGMDSATPSGADNESRLASASMSATAPPGEDAILNRAQARIEQLFSPSLRPVFNLTGTVLHTNLGRAPLPQEALDAIAAVAAGASNLEFDLARGARGDRDDHVESLILRLTGAEAATIVNNNAAAVLLVLGALALKREVPVSRGELIEIGGSFRLPDIMARAGCKLREVGTTNRTHLADFAGAINLKTALVMKAHTSNFVVRGFTASVPESELAALCHEHGVPFVVDLGAGSLVDLAALGLPHEPTVRETLAQGADIVTFSGDKLLGGPQAGIIAGRADLIAKIKRNPLKRALRVDKMTLAALEAVLRLYLHPERLCERVPALRLLTRSVASIRACAAQVQPVLAAKLAGWATVTAHDCASEAGSGAQPLEQLPSAGLAITPLAVRGRGAALNRLAAALRALPVPVIGRIEHDALVLDLRCAEDANALTTQLALLPSFA